MKRIFLIHRWSGGPSDDWRPWLKAELDKLGHQVFAPEMPDTDLPVIEKWVRKLSEDVGTPDSDTYFVGHSIGCQAILRYLETISTPVGGAVFVAGWFNLKNLESEGISAIAKPWIETPISVESVKAVLPQSTLIISSNDPYGCLDENQKRFAELVTKTVVVRDAGHFTEDDGFKTLPLALEEILSVIEKHAA